MIHTMKDPLHFSMQQVPHVSVINQCAKLRCNYKPDINTMIYSHINTDAYLYHDLSCCYTTFKNKRIIHVLQNALNIDMPKFIALLYIQQCVHVLIMRSKPKTIILHSKSGKQIICNYWFK